MWKIWAKNKQTYLLCLSPKFSNEIKLQKDLVEDKRPPIILGKHQYIYIYIYQNIYHSSSFSISSLSFETLPCLCPAAFTNQLYCTVEGLRGRFSKSDGGWGVNNSCALPVSVAALWQRRRGWWPVADFSTPSPPQREPSPPIIRCNRW